jgi:hypothetical protein
MMRPLVLEGDFDFLPTHIDYGDKLSIFAIDGYLGPRRWVTGLDHQQP